MVKRRKRTPVIIISVCLGSLIVALGLGFLMDYLYSERVLPGVTLGGTDISGMPLDEVDAFLIKTAAAMNLNLSVAGETRQASAADLGITINESVVQADVENAVNQLLWIYRFNRPTSIPLDLNIDRHQFNSWLAENYPDSFESPINAGLTYNAETHLYDLTESALGTGIAQEELAFIQETLSTTDEDPTFTIVPTVAEPLVSDEQAADAQAWANQRLATQCSFTRGEETIYTLTPWDIASLTILSLNSDVGLAPGYNIDQITEFVQEYLVDAVDLKPEARVVTVDQSGNVLRVVSEGAPGRTLTNSETLPEQILYCLTEATNTASELTFDEVPFTVEETLQTIPAPPQGSASSHWADVNLTTQTVTLMNGSTPSASFVMSSGAPGTETPTGTFRVYAKTRIQTVRGCAGGECYSFPNVRWLTWFKGDYGFHTAYWHENFGTPVSHGCLNLREADAKSVFDWLSNGNHVLIHN
ncbi:MAG: L,D-transpeptidase [Propionibacteriaceae bacterium]|nr:L,D-transpeptidase [Propionibacteriaceae bacterium]